MSQDDLAEPSLSVPGCAEGARNRFGFRIGGARAPVEFRTFSVFHRILDSRGASSSAAQRAPGGQRMPETPAFARAWSVPAQQAHERAQGFRKFRGEAVDEAELAERKNVSAARAVVNQRGSLILGEQTGREQLCAASQVEVQRMLGFRRPGAPLCRRLR